MLSFLIYNNIITYDGLITITTTSSISKADIYIQAKLSQAHKVKV